jgi:hypothetical protein
MASRLRRTLRQTELHLFLFFFFLVLFLIPVLRGDGPEQAAASYRHFFLVWGVCIGALFFIGRALKSPFPEQRPRQRR